jgi:hypothetical protein
VLTPLHVHRKKDEFDKMRFPPSGCVPSDADIRRDNKIWSDLQASQPSPLAVPAAAAAAASSSSSARNVRPLRQAIIDHKQADVINTVANTSTPASMNPVTKDTGHDETMALQPIPDNPNSKKTPADRRVKPSSSGNPLVELGLGVNRITLKKHEAYTKTAQSDKDELWYFQLQSKNTDLLDRRIFVYGAVVHGNPLNHISAWAQVRNRTEEKKQEPTGALQLEQLGSATNQQVSVQPLEEKKRGGENTLQNGVQPAAAVAGTKPKKQRGVPLKLDSLGLWNATLVTGEKVKTLSTDRPIHNMVVVANGILYDTEQAYLDTVQQQLSVATITPTDGLVCAAQYIYRCSDEPDYLDAMAMNTLPEALMPDPNIHGLFSEWLRPLASTYSPMRLLYYLDRVCAPPLGVTKLAEALTTAAKVVKDDDEALKRVRSAVKAHRSIISETRNDLTACGAFDPASTNEVTDALTTQVAATLMSTKDSVISTINGWQAAIFRCPQCQRLAWTMRTQDNHLCDATQLMFCGHDECELTGPLTPHRQLQLLNRATPQTFLIVDLIRILHDASAVKPSYARRRITQPELRGVIRDVVDLFGVMQDLPGVSGGIWSGVPENLRNAIIRSAELLPTEAASSVGPLIYRFSPRHVVMFSHQSQSRFDNLPTTERLQMRFQYIPAEVVLQCCIKQKNEVPRIDSDTAVGEPKLKPARVHASSVLTPQYQALTEEARAYLDATFNSTANGLRERVLHHFKPTMVYLLRLIHGAMQCMMPPSLSASLGFDDLQDDDEFARIPVSAALFESIVHQMRLWIDQHLAKAQKETSPDDQELAVVQAVVFHLAPDLLTQFSSLVQPKRETTIPELLFALHQCFWKPHAIDPLARVPGAQYATDISGYTTEYKNLAKPVGGRDSQLYRFIQECVRYTNLEYMHRNEVADPALFTAQDPLNLRDHTSVVVNHAMYTVVQRFWSDARQLSRQEEEGKASEQKSSSSGSSSEDDSIQVRKRRARKGSSTEQKSRSSHTKKSESSGDPGDDDDDDDDDEMDEDSPQSYYHAALRDLMRYFTGHTYAARIRMQYGGAAGTMPLTPVTAEQAVMMASLVGIQCLPDLALLHLIPPPKPDTQVDRTSNNCAKLLRAIRQKVLTAPPQRTFMAHDNLQGYQWIESLFPLDADAEAGIDAFPGKAEYDNKNCSYAMTVFRAPTTELIQTCINQGILFLASVADEATLRVMYSGFWEYQTNAIAHGLLMRHLLPLDEMDDAWDTPHTGLMTWESTQLLWQLIATECKKDTMDARILSLGYVAHPEDDLTRECLRRAIATWKVVETALNTFGRGTPEQRERDRVNKFRAKLDGLLASYDDTVNALREDTDPQASESAEHVRPTRSLIPEFLNVPLQPQPSREIQATLILIGQWFLYGAWGGHANERGVPRGRLEDADDESVPALVDAGNEMGQEAGHADAKDVGGAPLENADAKDSDDAMPDIVIAVDDEDQESDLGVAADNEDLEEDNAGVDGQRGSARQQSSLRFIKCEAPLSKKSRGKSWTPNKGYLEFTEMELWAGLNHLAEASKLKPEPPLENERADKRGQEVATDNKEKARDTLYDDGESAEADELEQNVDQAAAGDALDGDDLTEQRAALLNKAVDAAAGRVLSSTLGFEFTRLNDAARMIPILLPAKTPTDISHKVIAAVMAIPTLEERINAMGQVLTVCYLRFLQSQRRSLTDMKLVLSRWLTHVAHTCAAGHYEINTLSAHGLITYSALYEHVAEVNYKPEREWLMLASVPHVALRPAHEFLAIWLHKWNEQKIGHDARATEASLQIRNIAGALPELQRIAAIRGLKAFSGVVDAFIGNIAKMLLQFAMCSRLIRDTTSSAASVQSYRYLVYPDSSVTYTGQRRAERRTWHERNLPIPVTNDTATQSGASPDAYIHECDAMLKKTRHVFCTSEARRQSYQPDRVADHNLTAADIVTIPKHRDADDISINVLTADYIPNTLCSYCGNTRLCLSGERWPSPGSAFVCAKCVHGVLMVRDKKEQTKQIADPRILPVTSYPSGYPIKFPSTVENVDVTCGCCFDVIGKGTMLGDAVGPNSEHEFMCCKCYLQDLLWYVPCREAYSNLPKEDDDDEDHNARHPWMRINHFEKHIATLRSNVTRDLMHWASRDPINVEEWKKQVLESEAKVLYTQVDAKECVNTLLTQIQQPMQLQIHLQDLAWQLAATALACGAVCYQVPMVDDVDAAITIQRQQRQEARVEAERAALIKEEEDQLQQEAGAENRERGVELERENQALEQAKRELDAVYDMMTNSTETIHQQEFILLQLESDMAEIPLGGEGLVACTRDIASTKEKIAAHKKQIAACRTRKDELDISIAQHELRIDDLETFETRLSRSAHEVTAELKQLQQQRRVHVEEEVVDPAPTPTNHSYRIVRRASPDVSADRASLMQLLSDLGNPGTSPPRFTELVQRVWQCITKKVSHSHLGESSTLLVYAGRRDEKRNKRGDLLPGEEPHATLLSGIMSVSSIPECIDYETRVSPAYIECRDVLNYKLCAVEDVVHNTHMLCADMLRDPGVSVLVLSRREPIDALQEVYSECVHTHASVARERERERIAARMQHVLDHARASDPATLRRDKDKVQYAKAFVDAYKKLRADSFDFDQNESKCYTEIRDAIDPLYRHALAVGMEAGAVLYLTSRTDWKKRLDVTGNKQNSKDRQLLDHRYNAQYWAGELSDLFQALEDMNPPNEITVLPMAFAIARDAWQTLNTYYNVDELRKRGADPVLRIKDNHPRVDPFTDLEKWNIPPTNPPPQ